MSVQVLCTYPGDPGLAGTNITTKIMARRMSTTPVIASMAMTKCCARISGLRLFVLDGIRTGFEPFTSKTADDSLKALISKGFGG